MEVNKTSLLNERLRQLLLLCESGSEVSNGTLANKLAGRSGLAYIAGLPTVAKVEVSACLLLAAAGACLYARSLSAMVRRRLPHCHVTLASSLTALFPVCQWLICLAILVPKSADFMHVLMATYAMMAFNSLVGLLSFEFGAVRFILGRRCVLTQTEAECEVGGRVTVVRTKPLWTRFQLLMVRALVRQGQLLHCLNLALTAAIQLDSADGRTQLQAEWPPQPLAVDWVAWLRGLAGVSRLASSLAAVAFVCRCSRRPAAADNPQPPLIANYRLGAKFSALAVANAAQMALQSAALFADCSAGGGADAAADYCCDSAMHAQFALQLLLTVLQGLSLFLFHRSPPPSSLPPSFASTVSACRSKPQRSLSPSEQRGLRGSRSPSATAELGVDDSVPADAAACGACRRHRTESTDELSRDVSSATTRAFGY